MVNSLNPVFALRSGILLGLGALSCFLASQSAQFTAPDGASDRGWRMPLVFEQNRGQTSSESAYLARGRGYTLGISSGVERFHYESAGRPWESGFLKLELAGTTKSKAENCEKKRGVVNYLYGKDPRRWITGVPTCGRVDFRAVYPGIDLTYYFNDKRTLERDFIVRPGADPARIRYRIAGQHRPAVDASGGLELAAGSVMVRQDPPVAYQEIAGRRRPVEVAYAVEPSLRDGGEYELTFSLGAYDRREPLIIDPVRPRVVSHRISPITPPAVVVYKVYTGTTTTPNPIPQDARPSGVEESDDPLPGSTTDFTLTGEGDILACGATNSHGFPTTPDAEQVGFGGGSQDAWVARVGATGAEFRFCTYFGGVGEDRAFGVRLDDAGNPCITGFTDSEDLPTELPFQANLAGGVDAFIALFSADGSAVKFASYMGGTGDDYASALARDDDGKFFVTGRTTSQSTSLTRFPATPGAFQHDLAGIEDAFLTKVDTATRKIEFSTFYGGIDVDRSNAVFCDPDGITIAGQTLSSDLPIHAASQPARKGGVDAFAARFNTAGTGLHFGTYLGGSSTDFANELAADPDGAIYVIGETLSANFPSGRGALELASRKRDAFLVRIPAEGGSHNALLLSGKEEDIGFAVHAPDPNVAYLTGTTNSSDFAGAEPANRKKHEIFISEVEFGGAADAPSLLGSFVESGDGEDGAYAITTRDFPRGRRVYLAGKTNSSDLTRTNLDPNRAAGDTGQFLMAFDDRYVQPKSFSVKFKATKVRRSLKAKFQVFNRETAAGATAPIDVSEITGPFTVARGGDPDVIEPDGSHTIVIAFKPTAPGPAAGTLKIKVLDPFPRTLSIALSGKGKR